MRIAVLTAAVAVAVLVGWYLLRDRESGAVPAAEPAAVVERAVTPPIAPALPTPDAEDDPTAIVDATHATMQALGRKCFVERAPRVVRPNEPDDTVGRLELQLRIRVTSGMAQVETADVVTTRRLRDDLRDCIVAASRAARWPIDAPDGVQDMVELFRMGDFVAVPNPQTRPPVR